MAGAGLAAVAAGAAAGRFLLAEAPPAAAYEGAGGSRGLGGE